MKRYGVFFIAALLCQYLSPVLAQPNEGIADSDSYLAEIKLEMQKAWPENRTINLVFHGHSVPAGYHKTPDVRPFESYPLLLLKELKDVYPNAVINIINTSIGGENAQSGQERLRSEVLIHQPDVLFIDYALNDRGIGLENAKGAWESMIHQANQENIRIILLTPSPDQQVNILEEHNELEQHALQIKSLSFKYGIGLVDSYKLFRNIATSGGNLPDYMSQVNHPNLKGHELITKEIMKYFK